jgi:hypothetical protein
MSTLLARVAGSTLRSPTATPKEIRAAPDAVPVKTFARPTETLLPNRRARLTRNRCATQYQPMGAVDVGAFR